MLVRHAMLDANHFIAFACKQNRFLSALDALHFIQVYFIYLFVRFNLMNNRYPIVQWICLWLKNIARNISTTLS